MLWRALLRDAGGHRGGCCHSPGERGNDQRLQAKPHALLISGSPSFTSPRHALVALAAEHRLPANYDQRAFVEAGGLISYGDFPAAYRTRLAF